MPLATVYSRAQLALDAPQVSVEVHLSGGLPGLSIVGLVETAVKESKDRVRAAISNAGFKVPDRRIVVSLAPADLPKGGSRFDLPIAIGILAASGQLAANRLSSHEFIGELALSGELRGIPAVLPAVMQAVRTERCVIVPRACAAEAALLGSGRVRVAGTLLEVVRHLQGIDELSVASPTRETEPLQQFPDISDVCGQHHAKRALEIAAAGKHNLLMVGPPGTGKSMLAARLAGLLPSMSHDTALVSAALHSLAGVARKASWRAPPFRAPHHTASAVALVGGTAMPRPGEISLAHGGVLFLDELPEFERRALDALREPLQTGRINIARAGRSAEFPANFQLIAAMNPCPCGFYGDPQRECRCSPDQVRRYQGRLSGPFLDRLEMSIELSRRDLDWKLDAAPCGESSTVFRQRVVAAVVRQRARCGKSNGEMDGSELMRWCLPDAKGKALLQDARLELAMSARACNNALRVARTIADLAGEDNVNVRHVSESLAYRQNRYVSPSR